MQIKNYIRTLLVALTAVALHGCSDQGCMNNRNSIPMAGFYLLQGEQSVSVSNLEVFGVGAPGDSLLLDTVRSAHQIYLPLRGDIPRAQFVFRSGDVDDTLTVDYTAWPYFDGEDCGAMWRYELQNVSWQRTLIDSVRVTDKFITNQEREQLMIFLREQ